MDEEIAERLTRLESVVAHLDHLTERLNEVVTEQAREIAHLQKRLERQAQSLETMELDRVRATNSKPPHYQ